LVCYYFAFQGLKVAVVEDEDEAETGTGAELKTFGDHFEVISDWNLSLCKMDLLLKGRNGLS